MEQQINLNIKKGTVANLRSHLSDIEETDLLLSIDKDVPIPESTDAGKVIMVNSNGEYELRTIGEPEPGIAAGIYIDAEHTTFATMPSKGGYEGEPATWDNLLLAFFDCFDISDDGKNITATITGNFLDAFSELDEIHFVIADYITSIDCEFENITNLYSVMFETNSNFRVFNSRTFVGCTNLETVELPKLLLNLGEETFSGCTSLRSIIIPMWVITIGSAFKDCTNLENITFNCKFLKTLGWNTFENCSSLTAITLPNTISDFWGPFPGCSSLTTVNIPTSAYAIGDAFTDCTSLQSITIPANIREVTSAFQGCTSLTEVIFENTDNWTIYSTGESIDVSDPSVNAYNLTEGDWANIVLYRTE